MAKKVTPRTDELPPLPIVQYISRPALSHEEVAEIANAVLKQHFDLKTLLSSQNRLIRAAIIAGIEVALAKQAVKGDEA